MDRPSQIQLNYLEWLQLKELTIQLQAKLDIAVDSLEKIASLRGPDDGGHDAEYWLDRSIIEANNALSQIETV